MCVEAVPRCLICTLSCFMVFFIRLPFGSVHSNLALFESRKFSHKLTQTMLNFRDSKSYQDLILAQMHSLMITHAYLFHSSPHLRVIVPSLLCLASWKAFLGLPSCWFRRDGPRLFLTKSSFLCAYYYISNRLWPLICDLWLYWVRRSRPIDLW